MAWTTPKAWTGSEVLTSADMNTYVGSNLDYLFDNTVAANQWINSGTNVTQANQRIESGTEGIPLNKVTYGSIAITFNAAFGTAPRVVMTETAMANVTPCAFNVGTGGFTAYITNGSGGTTIGSSYFSWIAIGA